MSNTENVLAPSNQLQIVGKNKFNLVLVSILQLVRSFKWSNLGTAIALDSPGGIF